MKHITLFLGIFLLLLAGCQQDDLVPFKDQDKSLKSVRATTSSVVKSRTSLSGNSVIWENGDAIGIFSDVSDSIARYDLTGMSGDEAQFESSKPVRGNTFYAFYPYAADAMVSGTNVSFCLPAEQSFNFDSFASGVCPMVAQSTTNSFRFLQVCGLVRLNLKGNMNIQSISLSGNNGEALAGLGSVNIASDAPEFRLSGGGQESYGEIVLQGNVTLSPSQTTSFYFVVPPQVFSKGMTFKITGVTNGRIHTLSKTTDKSITVGRSIITSFTAVDTDNLLEQEKLSEREALIALYDATGGNNWRYQNNWCSDKPISEWYGVTVGKNGMICSLDLSYNRLQGSLPEEIGNLATIEHLNLSNNQLSGELPIELFNLGHLSFLNLESNKFSGNLSSGIGKLKGLKNLLLEENNFIGTLPAELGELSGLQQIELSYNKFEGKIPKEISQSEWWKICGWVNLCQVGNGFDLESANLYLTDFTMTDMNGEIINSTEIIKSHELTLYYLWLPEGTSYHEEIASIYRKFKDYGVAVLGASPVDTQNREIIESYISKYKMEWPTLTSIQPYSRMACNKMPNALLFNKDGKLIYHSDVVKISYLKGIIEDLLGDHFNPYVSTNYNADGKSVLLQSAKIGKGINVIFLGDGFSDRQIADGTYDQVMRRGMEAFFNIQPFAYFRDYFTVYYVNAVSKNEGYIEDGETAFSCIFQENNGISGIDDRCKSYALKSGITNNANDDIGRQLLIINILNSPKYIGSCKMYGYQFHQDGDHSVGWSVAYVTRADDAEVFEHILQHEACGHGFAKLGDEYFNLNTNKTRAIVTDDVSYYHSVYGWFKNIYVENASKELYWQKFIEDERYQSEQIGWYKGAYNNSERYFRPTETSIMRDIMGGFNAPSREAIYYRIHKLAFGINWEYSYESFVKWDLEYGMPSFLLGNSRSVMKKRDIKLISPCIHIQ